MSHSNTCMPAGSVLTEWPWATVTVPVVTGLSNHYHSSFPSFNICHFLPLWLHLRRHRHRLGCTGSINNNSRSKYPPQVKVRYQTQPTLIRTLNNKLRARCKHRWRPVCCQQRRTRPVMRLQEKSLYKRYRRSVQWTGHWWVFHRDIASVFGLLGHVTLCGESRHSFVKGGSTLLLIAFTRVLLGTPVYRFEWPFLPNSISLHQFISYFFIWFKSCVDQNSDRSFIEIGAAWGADIQLRRLLLDRNSYTQWRQYYTGLWFVYENPGHRSPEARSHWCGPCFLKFFTIVSKG